MICVDVSKRQTNSMDIINFHFVCLPKGPKNEGFVSNALLSFPLSSSSREFWRNGIAIANLILFVCGVVFVSPDGRFVESTA